MQQWIRSKKQRRLQRKWISSLEFEDSYWILQDPFGSREWPVIHFAENGRIEVRARQKQSHLFSNSSGYRHPANETLIIELNNGTIKTLSILAISENRFVLVESNGSHAVVLEESPDSTYFDSLPKTAE
ncbi:hypothetical protein OAM04_00630 [bacterium]|nr:hypothetical protein [bacterium]